MIGLLVLVAAALTVWAHLRVPATSERGLHRELAWFAGASLAQSLLLALARRGPSSSPARWALVLAALCGLLTWFAIARLVARDTRPRDLWLRVPVLVLAALALLWGSWRGSLLLASIAILSYRWKSTFETARLFQLGVLAMALAVIELSAPGPSVAGLTGWLRAAAGFALVTSKAAGAYAAYGGLALLMAFVRDPTLGIQRVSRRLALSHVMVGLVPVLLVLALWTTTTVLGVNQEKVHVGARALEREGEQLGNVLEVALATADDRADPLRSMSRLHAVEWPGLRVWRRASGRVEQVCGAPLEDATAVGGWLDSLGSLPDRGLVAFRDSLFLGAAARVDRQEAVAMTPILPLVSSLVRVAGTPLGIQRNSDRLIVNPLALLGRDTSASSVVLGMFTKGYVMVRGLSYGPDGWKRSSFTISGGSRASQTLAGLFDLSPENPLGYLPLVLLANVAFLFLLIAIWDVIMVVNVGRGIARALERTNRTERKS